MKTNFMGNTSNEGKFVRLPWHVASFHYPMYSLFWTLLFVIYSPAYMVHNGLIASKQIDPDLFISPWMLPLYMLPSNTKKKGRLVVVTWILCTCIVGWSAETTGLGSNPWFSSYYGDTPCQRVMCLRGSWIRAASKRRWQELYDISLESILTNRHCFCQREICDREEMGF